MGGLVVGGTHYFIFVFLDFKTKRNLKLVDTTCTTRKEVKKNDLRSAEVTCYGSDAHLLHTNVLLLLGHIYFKRNFDSYSAIVGFGITRKTQFGRGECGDREDTFIHSTLV